MRRRGEEAAEERGQLPVVSRNSIQADFHECCMSDQPRRLASEVSLPTTVPSTCWCAI
jgi:hypothetical protein